jgi:hypothetical protein
MARLLDGARQHALMLRAGSRLSPGPDFLLLVHKPFEQIHLLIIKGFRIVGTELANSGSPRVTASLL